MKHLTEEEVIAYLESDAPSSDHQAHLAGCSKCQKILEAYEEIIHTMAQSTEVAPPAHIAPYIGKAIISESKPTTRWRYWQAAAAVSLLAIGFVTGQLMTNDRSEKIIALQSQVEILKEVALTNALHHSSASERLQVVNRIETETTASSQTLINTLFKTLNNDASPNVRYAAAQALNRYTKDDTVRRKLAESLELQSDPLIQIALISMLMETQEKHAIRPLKKMLKEENMLPEVKRQAQIALDILS